MSYTVFARKYRPQSFDDVIGQDHITRTLKNAIEQKRLAHAYIFVGPRGTGKTSTARILAKALNCQSFPDPTSAPCGHCDSCKEIAAGSSLDVLEFDAASNTQVDKIRELIIENVKYAPSRGRFKVYIVDEVHMLSTSSFNALLKTLEEPPEHVKFFFATTDVQKVPTTILSRCQRFDLKRIAPAQIASHLLAIAGKEKLNLSPAGAEAVARGAEGGMRDAESMLDQLVAFCGEKIEEGDVLSIFGFTSLETVATLCDHLIGGDTCAALGVVHEQNKAGRDLSRLLSDLITYLRNLLVAQVDPSGMGGEITRQEGERLTVQADRVKTEKLLELIEQLAGAEQRMKWASNKKMILEVAFIRAVQTLGQATLSEVLEALAAMKGATASAGARAETSPPSGSRAVKAGTAARAPALAGEPPKQEEAGEKVKPSESDRTRARSSLTPPEAPEAMAPASTPPSPAQPSLSSPEELWQRLAEEIRSQRPLIYNWVAAGKLLSLEKGVAVLGFPADQTLACDYCQQPANRALLETLLGEIAGIRVQLKTRICSDLPASPPPAVAAKESLPPTAAKVEPTAEFRNDPLIRKALEVFRAEIQPV